MLKAFLLLLAEKILGLECSLAEELVPSVCQDLNLVLSTEKSGGGERRGKVQNHMYVQTYSSRKPYNL